MDIHVYLHIVEGGEAMRKLDLIADQVRALSASFITQGKKIMATLDQVVDDVAQETTLVDGVNTLVTGLKQQLADALSGASLPPAVQAKVDQVFAGLEANKASLAGALAASTPADTGTPVPPVVPVP